MQLNRKEIEKLKEFEINNLDCDIFELIQEQTGIGVITKISRKLSETKQLVEDVTDYGCW
jgi:hypothetical protein